MKKFSQGMDSDDNAPIPKSEYRFMPNIKMTHRIYNLGIIYISAHSTSGWMRLFSRWYGLSWKLHTEPLLFSERIGKTKLYRIGKWNVKILKPVR